MLASTMAKNRVDAKMVNMPITEIFKTVSSFKNSHVLFCVFLLFRFSLWRAEDKLVSLWNLRELLHGS